MDGLESVGLFWGKMGKILLAPSKFFFGNFALKMDPDLKTPFCLSEFGVPFCNF